MNDEVLAVPTLAIEKNWTNNNIEILKKVIFRFSEMIVRANDAILESGDYEKIKFMINNIINRYPFTDTVRDVMLLEENGYSVDFLPGSALSKINALVQTSKDDDINYIASLYTTEASFFMSELREKIRPTLIKLASSFEDEKRIKMKTTGSNYSIKLVAENDLLSLLKDSGYLRIIGNGELPATLALNFPLSTEVLENDVAMREMFVTGEAEIDNLASSFLDKCKTEDLIKFWNTYMSNISSGNNNLEMLRVLHYRKLNDVILLYLALKRMLNGKILYCSSLESFEKNTVNLSDMINTIITKFMDFYDNMKDNGFLLDYYVDDKNMTNIYLIQNNFNKYLEEGGDVDSIVGYVVKAKANSLPRFSNMNNILSDATLKQFYERNVKAEKMADYSFNLNTISSQWNSYASKIIYEFSNITDLRTIKLNLSKEAEDAIYKYIRNLRDDEVFETNKVLKEILKIINVDAYDFINNMNTMARQVSENQEEENREAGLYAIVQRLTYLLLKDTCTTKK